MEAAAVLDDCITQCPSQHVLDVRCTEVSQIGLHTNMHGLIVTAS